MNLSEIAIEITEKLSPIEGLNAFSFQPGSIIPPAAIVLNPSPGDFVYSRTYRRGMDSCTLPLIVFVGRADNRQAQADARLYIDGSGPRSIIETLESATYATLHTIKVTTGGIDSVMMGGQEMLAALFDMEITGSGSGS